MPTLGNHGRQDLTQALDQLEEVVGPVDLVHLAGLAVADDERRAVDRPGQLAFLAHDLLALVLGHEVGVIQAFGFFEHVLAEHPFVQTCGGDAADVMHVPRVHRLGELHQMSGAFDVDLDLALRVRRQVVDGRQVVDRIDPPLERLDGAAADTQLARREIATDRHGAVAADAPEVVQGIQLAFTARAQQEVHDAAAPRQQGLDESLADEAGGAGDEILHGCVSRNGRCRAERSAGPIGREA
jgi:hypothetical protein